MRVLVVDDSMINLNVTKKMLEKFGVDVDITLNGKECLEKAKSTSYDIIFMDIMMPELSGIETFKLLKEIKDFNTPVIALTADADIESKEKYLSFGFSDYIPKPIKIDLLKNVIDKFQ